MPAKRTPRAADQPEPGEAGAVEASPAESEASATADGDVEAAPLNRAEGRARGKTKPQAQVSGRGKVAGGHGPAHTQRMWSNRRSGG